MRLSPLSLVSGFRNLHSVASGGGPKLVRLVSVGAPEGLVIQTSEVVLEVEAKDGRTVRMAPQLPMPFLWGWGIRLARKLGVPLISDLKPEHFSAEVPVPGAR
jgi:hypothetical protein